MVPGLVLPATGPLGPLGVDAGLRRGSHPRTRLLLLGSVQGGKGIATSAGAFLGLSPWGVLVALLVWIAVTFSTRIVSAGSLAAAVALPVSLLFVPHKGGNTLLLFTVGVAIFVFWAHRANIRRLLQR